MAEKEVKEPWENRNKSVVWIETYDTTGKLKPTKVSPGQKVYVTPLERRINSEKAWSEKQDIFSNGALTRAAEIAVFDTAEDYEEIKGNPNTMSEAEISSLLTLTAPKLKKELEGITSPFVLTRLKELTEEEESDLTVAKVNAIKSRFDEVLPSKTGKVFDAWNTEGVKKVVEL